MTLPIRQWGQLLLQRLKPLSELSRVKAFRLVYIMGAFWAGLHLGGHGASGLAMFHASNQPDREECQLDSFSEPALALTILKQEVDDSCCWPSDEDAQGEPARLSRLELLRKGLGELSFDFEWQMQSIYLRNKMWDEFVNGYLRILSRWPERADVDSSRSALECSALCGRKDEVIDAIEHVRKFQPGSKAAVRLSSVLAELPSSAPNDPGSRR